MAKQKIPKRQKVLQKQYTEKDLNDAARKACESAAKFNVYLTMGSVLLALHELYGFGNKRCNDMIDKAMEIEFNALNYTELLDEVKEKVGIDLREREAKRNEPL